MAFSQHELKLTQSQKYKQFYNRTVQYNLYSEKQQIFWIVDLLKCYHFIFDLI